jgi:phage repressor protein C with HTH and peptisase S24 domain
MENEKVKLLTSSYQHDTNNLPKAIKLYLAMNEISLREFSIKIDKDLSIVSRVINGKRPLTVKFLSNILNKYPELETYLENQLAIPVMDIKPAAGALNNIIPSYNNTPIGTMLSEELKGCIGVFQVQGDSMVPKLKPNQWVCFLPPNDVLFGGSMYYIEFTEDFGHHPLVKYVRENPSDKNTLILRSENDKYQDITVKKTDIQRIYKVRADIQINFYE